MNRTVNLTRSRHWSPTRPNLSKRMTPTTYRPCKQRRARLWRLTRFSLLTLPRPARSVTRLRPPRPRPSHRPPSRPSSPAASKPMPVKFRKPRRKLLLLLQRRRPLLPQRRWLFKKDRPMRCRNRRHKRRQQAMRSVRPAIRPSPKPLRPQRVRPRWDAHSSHCLRVRPSWDRSAT